MRPLTCVVFAILLSCSYSWGYARVYPYRWVFVSRLLRTDDDLAAVERIVQTASESGLNGIVLSAGLDSLSRLSPDYVERLESIRALCSQLHMDLIPCVFSIGYGGAVLAHNENLAEGLLVGGASFIVKDGQALFESDTPVEIANAGFEQYDGHRASAWYLQDGPGDVSFIDTTLSRTGRASLLFEHFGQYDGHGRVMQEVDVRPHRCYQLSCWVRTDSLEPEGAFLVQVLGPDGRILAPYDPEIPSTTDWHRVVLGFNSLGYDAVRVYAGVWGGEGGRFWLDDFAIEEVALLNVLRRPGTPVVVKDAASGEIYEEGRDFARVEDDHLTFRFDHEPPTIGIMADGQIEEGERLLVSYYHGMAIYGGQVSVCMSEPEVYEIWREQADLMHQYLAPSKYLLSMDEIRAGGSCQACKSRNLTMAEILGDCITKQVAILREVSPMCEVFIWSDMLDPNHNAHDNYYLVEGDLTDSWKHVPNDLTIVCWYYGNRNKSLSFFSSRGFRTLAAAYCDDDTLEIPRGWLEVMDDTPGAVGITYMTWQNKYDLLGAFGDLVVGTGER